MRILFVHAHYDDYEFTTAGLFELWRRKLGKDLRARVLVCTDGKAGHHFRTREETGRVRYQEQQQAATLGQFEFQALRLPDGEQPREACLQVTIPLLATLWKSIRSFEPDYLFCPPLVTDPLAGLHNDHQTVAEAVRRVAYMINVPHAFTPEFPADETQSTPCKVPVIVHAYDGYQFGANSYDIAVDAEEAFDLVSDLSWCHQSQIAEWIPWVGRHQMAAPSSRAEWGKTLRTRASRRNRELGIQSDRYLEVFNLSAWGEVPDWNQIARDWPGIDLQHSRIAALKERLAKWHGEA